MLYNCVIFKKYKLHFIVCQLKELICFFIPCKLYLTKVIIIFGNFLQKSDIFFIITLIRLNGIKQLFFNAHAAKLRSIIY